MSNLAPYQWLYHLPIMAWNGRIWETNIAITMPLLWVKHLYMGEGPAKPHIIVQTPYCWLYPQHAPIIINNHYKKKYLFSTPIHEITQNKPIHSHQCLKPPFIYHSITIHQPLPRDSMEVSELSSCCERMGSSWKCSGKCWKDTSCAEISASFLGGNEGLRP